MRGAFKLRWSGCSLDGPYVSGLGHYTTVCAGQKDRSQSPRPTFPCGTKPILPHYHDKVLSLVTSVPAIFACSEASSVSGAAGQSPRQSCPEVGALIRAAVGSVQETAESCQRTAGPSRRVKAASSSLSSLMSSLPDHNSVPPKSLS